MRIPFSALILSVLLVGVCTQAEPGKSVTTHAVMIENMKFTPVVLHLKLGDRVIFKNLDLVPHTATAKDARLFDSGSLLENQTWEYQPPMAGTIPYRCLFHPLMEGSLVVEPAEPES